LIYFYKYEILSLIWDLNYRGSHKVLPGFICIFENAENTVSRVY